MTRLQRVAKVLQDNITEGLFDFDQDHWELDGNTARTIANLVLSEADRTIKRTVVCSDCGCEQITRLLTEYWDIACDEWMTSDVEYVCADCGDERSITFKEAS